MLELEKPVFRSWGRGGGKKEGEVPRDLTCKRGSKRSHEGKTVTKVPLKGQVSQDKQSKTK